MKFKEPTRVEMLKAQVLMTKTGFPATLEMVEAIYGKAFPAPEHGWFWVGATPRAARAIRHRGLRAIGKMTTTVIPVQYPHPPIESFDPNLIPVVGSPEHTVQMIKEKEEVS